MKELNYILIILLVGCVGMNYVPKAGVVMFSEDMKANTLYKYNCTNSPTVINNTQMNQACDYEEL